MDLKAYCHNSWIIKYNGNTIRCILIGCLRAHKYKTLNISHPITHLISFTCSNVPFFLLYKGLGHGQVFGETVHLFFSLSQQCVGLDQLILVFFQNISGHSELDIYKWSLFTQLRLLLSSGVDVANDTQTTHQGKTQQQCRQLHDGGLKRKLERTHNLSFACRCTDHQSYLSVKLAPPTRLQHSVKEQTLCLLRDLNADLKLFCHLCPS